MTPRLPRLYWMMISSGITNKKMNQTLVGSRRRLPFTQSGNVRRWRGGSGRAGSGGATEGGGSGGATTLKPS